MRLLAVIWVATVMFASGATADPIDARVYYKLSTDFRGIDMPLHVYNGGAKNNMTHLAPSADVSGQLWRLIAINDAYQLTTQFRGDGMCLYQPAVRQTHFRDSQSVRSLNQCRQGQGDRNGCSAFASARLHVG